MHFDKHWGGGIKGIYAVFRCGCQSVFHRNAVSYALDWTRDPFYEATE